MTSGHSAPDQSGVPAEAALRCPLNACFHTRQGVGNSLSDWHGIPGRPAVENTVLMDKLFFEKATSEL